MLKPSTYPCKLCGITYGKVGMKREWKEFVEGLDIPVEFLYRDEFKERFDHKDPEFPVAFIVENSRIEYFIEASEMNEVRDLEELMDMVKSKLRKLKDG